MRILVTGREGQVARSLRERADGHKLIFTGRPQFDLMRQDTIARTIEEIRPDLIISAAAYTKVDQAEDQPDLAMAVNSSAIGHIGRAGAAIGARVLHLSTDYVFDGSARRAWREDDPTDPIGVYGKTKLAGEQALAESGVEYAILRTAWVYSPFGSNFVKTMLNLAESRDVVNVVADQYGNPTSALDIGTALLIVAERWQQDPSHGVNQIYHFGGCGHTNWADFAREIFTFSARNNGPSCDVTGIPSTEYPTRAKRPKNSCLDSGKFAETFGYRAPYWRASLSEVVERLVAK